MVYTHWNPSNEPKNFRERSKYLPPLVACDENNCQFTLLYLRHGQDRIKSQVNHNQRKTERIKNPFRDKICDLDQDHTHVLDHLPTETLKVLGEGTGLLGESTGLLEGRIYLNTNL